MNANEAYEDRIRGEHEMSEDDFSRWETPHQRKHPHPERVRSKEDRVDEIVSSNRLLCVCLASVRYSRGGTGNRFHGERDELVQEVPERCVDHRESRAGRHS